MPSCATTRISMRWCPWTHACGGGSSGAHREPARYWARSDGFASASDAPPSTRPLTSRGSSRAGCSPRTPARPCASGSAWGHVALLAPPTDLGELTALLKRCRLMIANDTGPLHLAAALGTPALGLFGPTSAERNGPYGRSCQGLQSPDGTMAGLEVSLVFDPARAVLEGAA